MRLISFHKDQQIRAGIVTSDDRVIDINLADSSYPTSLKKIIDNGLNLNSFSETHYNLSKVSIAAPITDPGLIVCVGLNYKDHADEVGLKYPESPLLFSKAPTALCGPNDDVIHPNNISKLDYEVELAIVIKKRCKNVKAEEALNYVAGFSTFHDVSARCAQFSDKQWFRGKSFDTFAPMGPFLVTPDEVADPDNLNLWCKVNGEIRQNSNTKSMFFSCTQLIEYISHSMTLCAGDIIATGTPAGVGAFMKNPIFLKAGDIVEMEVEGLGKICNKITQEYRNENVK